MNQKTKDQFIKFLVEEKGIKESSAKTYARSVEKKKGRIYPRASKLFTELIDSKANHNYETPNKKDDLKKSTTVTNEFTIKDKGRSSDDRIIKAIQSAIDLSDFIGVLKSFEMIKMILK